MTERLRILINISNYFQTLVIMEKTLSDKNEPTNKFIFTRIPSQNTHPCLSVQLIKETSLPARGMHGLFGNIALFSGGSVHLQHPACFFPKFHSSWTKRCEFVAVCFWAREMT